MQEKRLSNLIIDKFYFELFTSHLPKQLEEQEKKCDGCGASEIHREIISPLQVKVCICEKCWNEFLSNS